MYEVLSQKHPIFHDFVVGMKCERKNYEVILRIFVPLGLFCWISLELR